MYNPFSLENKTILVTGASSGIGRATAIECSKMGAKLIISGRNAERLQETFEQLEGHGHLQILANLANQEGIKSLIDKIEVIDGLVHSAGVGIALPFQFCNNEKVSEVINSNLVSPIALLHLMVKLKKYSRNGFSIVFISSIAGNIVSYPGNSIYSASKAGIVGLAKGMAIDLASKGIRVNCILPGMIETAMVESFEEIVSAEALEEDKKKYPLGRYGKPKDVAMSAIYLLSNASEWITGSNLVIDGGCTLL